MAKNAKEWQLQADYDLDTARAMFKSGRNVYAVFMCHLSVEKALKALYQMRYNEIPPKTHDLRYLLDKIDGKMTESQEKFLIRLNREGVTTRYPETLATLLAQYPNKVVSKYLESTEELVVWAANQQMKP